MQSRQNPRIGIVGGGLMGMALARKLAVNGCQVTVLERDDQIGGLATYQDYGKFYWDRFYHVILPSDRDLIEFVEVLGLSEALQWKRTFTGFYVDKHMHSISNNLEFLKFPLLSLTSKIRLAWTMFYGSRIEDWKKLEKITAEDWLVHLSGQSTYDTMWKPLLLAKLGENYNRVSAVFIWSYIKRLFSARHSAVSKEQLGHVAGGYKRIFETLQRLIESSGGSVKTGIGVTSIQAADSGGILLKTEAGEFAFDRVICTSPVPVLRKLVDPSLLDISSGGDSIEYLGVVCVVVASTEPMVPYYVVNIADKHIPFTGMIGMTNVISRENTAGQHLTYLPKYVLASDPLFQRDDDDIRQAFLEGVRQMLPNFNMNCIDSVHVCRAERVQPLQVLHFSSLVPKATTKHPDFFVLNTAQFVNATLNNNEVISAVNKFVAEHSESFMRP